MNAILSSTTHLLSPKSFFQNSFPESFWDILQSLKENCRKSGTLNDFLGAILDEVSKLYQQEEVAWYQAHRYHPTPNYESQDIRLLRSLARKQCFTEQEICHVLHEMQPIWEHSIEGIELNYGITSYNGGHLECMRIGDPYFGMDHWLLVKVESSFDCTCDRSYLVEFMETLARIYGERAHLFDFNRRISFQFDQVFDACQTPFCLSLDFEIQGTNFGNSRFLEKYGLEPAQILRVVSEKLKNWNETEHLYSCRKTKVSSFSIRIGNCDLIVLVKFDAVASCWKVVLNMDTIQKRRMDRARELLTRRQFEAFLHFEEGANCAKSLSKRMKISPRTAERYRSVILHFVGRELSPSNCCN